MEITLEQLLKGKATKIKDKEYYPTEAYVSPFCIECNVLRINLQLK